MPVGAEPAGSAALLRGRTAASAGGGAGMPKVRIVEIARTGLSPPRRMREVADWTSAIAVCVDPEEDWLELLDDETAGLTLGLAGDEIAGLTPGLESVLDGLLDGGLEPEPTGLVTGG